MRQRCRWRVGGDEDPEGDYENWREGGEVCGR